MILTDGHGRPIPKPEPSQFETAIEFVEARHAYYDEVRRVAVEAFDEAWRREARSIHL